MDKTKKEVINKTKSSDIIIFSPQELADLGILKNIQKVQEFSHLKSITNKKRIFEVIQKSLNASKRQPSTSTTSQALPIVNSKELKKNLMDKLSASRVTSENSTAIPSTSRKTSGSSVKIMNSEITMPQISLSGKVIQKSPESGKLIPSIINRKLKKQSRNTVSSTLTTGRSILNKDARIKEIIWSAVRSKTKKDYPHSDIRKTEPENQEVESLDESSSATETPISITNASKGLLKNRNMHIKGKDVVKIRDRFVEVKTEDANRDVQILTSSLPKSDIANSEVGNPEVENEIKKIRFHDSLSDSVGETVNTVTTWLDSNIDNNRLKDEQTSLSKSKLDRGSGNKPNCDIKKRITVIADVKTTNNVIQDHFQPREKKQSKVVSNTKTKEQFKNLINLEICKDEIPSNKGIQETEQNEELEEYNNCEQINVGKGKKKSSKVVNHNYSGDTMETTSNYTFSEIREIETCDRYREELKSNNDPSKENEVETIGTTEGVGELLAEYPNKFENFETDLQLDVEFSDRTSPKGLSADVGISTEIHNLSSSLETDYFEWLKSKNMQSESSEKLNISEEISSPSPSSSFGEILKEGTPKKCNTPEKKSIVPKKPKKRFELFTETGNVDQVDTQEVDSPTKHSNVNKTMWDQECAKKFLKNKSISGVSKTAGLQKLIRSSGNTAKNISGSLKQSEGLKKSKKLNKLIKRINEAESEAKQSTKIKKVLEAECTKQDQNLNLSPKVMKEKKLITTDKHMRPNLLNSQSIDSFDITPKKGGKSPKNLMGSSKQKHPTERKNPISTKLTKHVEEQSKISKKRILLGNTNLPSTQNDNQDQSMTEIKSAPEKFSISDNKFNSSDNQLNTIKEVSKERYSSKTSSSRVNKELQTKEIHTKIPKTRHNLERIASYPTVESNNTLERNSKGIEMVSNDCVSSQSIDSAGRVSRKRGRPRKNSLDTSKQKKLEAKSSEKDIQKSSIESTYSSDFVVDIDVSKSGRKRRKINYFNMENSFMEDPKMKNQSFDTDEDRCPPKNFDNVDQTTNLSKESFDCELDASVGSSSAAHLGETEETSNDNGSDDEPNHKKLRTKKYNWTGETQKLMKSIFSAAMKTGAPQTEETQVLKQQGNDGNKTPIQPSPKFRGRQKKAQVCTSVIIDNEGKVKCNTCNTKVVNKEWQSHNRNVHYNLAWREGDTFLCIEDHSFVRRTLASILHEDKFLACQNCNKEFHVANEFIVHRESCFGIVKDDLVTCAVCNEQIDKTKWMSHKKKKHNNLTWRVGDPPLDLNNQDLVMTILNTLYKAKVPLYCYKCNGTRKSVVGFLSHQTQCGNDIETAKVPCPLCGKRVLPVSMSTHHKLVHDPKPCKISNFDSKVETLNEVGSKRKAAKRAMKMIDTISEAKMLTELKKHYVESPHFKEEEFVKTLLNEELHRNNVLKCKFQNCVFKNKDLEQMVQHLDVCPKKPEQHFICKKCFCTLLSEDEVIKHVQEAHDIQPRADNDYVESDITDDEDDEKHKRNLIKIRRQESQQIAKSPKIKIKPRFLQAVFPRTQNKLFSNAFEYTLEFYNEHFTESVLFDRLRYLESDWKLLDDEHLEGYLPKAEFSCNVAIKIVPKYEDLLQQHHFFNTLELFEVVEHEDGATIFCGGPVTSMTWLPTPHILLHCKQVLAVAVAKDFDSTYLVNSNYNEKCMIQFWDFGILKKKIKLPKPILIFGLALNYGPIWHMEWCPSGCYDEKIFHNDRIQRMGLLAVAGSSPTVNIYSVPFIREADESNLVYQTNPLIKLQLFRHCDKTKTKCFPTKISWSKASGHKYVAVGYTDGMVAIFDIETTSEMLKFKDSSGIEIIFPYKTFKAHLHYISVLSLIHLGGGARYLLTGSFDRNVCVWDLFNDTFSLLSRRKVVSDGTWLTNWIAHVTTTDESNTNNVNVVSGLTSHRNYLYEMVNMMGTPATLNSVSSSDWLNGLLQSTSSGETLAIFPGQLMYCLDTDKRIKLWRSMLGYTKLIDLNKTPEERVREAKERKQSLRTEPKTKNGDLYSVTFMFNQSAKPKEYQPHTYENAVDKYGVVLCDINKKCLDELPKLNPAEVLEPSQPDLYPLQSINKVAFNPNSQASLYFAAGYQVGFVRIKYMKFLENDRQVV